MDDLLNEFFGQTDLKLGVACYGSIRTRALDLSLKNRLCCHLESGA